MAQTERVQALTQKILEVLPGARVWTENQDMGAGINAANIVEYDKAVKSREELVREIERLVKAAEVLAELRSEMRRRGVLGAEKIGSTWVSGSLEVNIRLFQESPPYWSIWIRYREVSRMSDGRVEVKRIGEEGLEYPLQKEFSDIRVLPKIIEEAANIVSRA